MPDPSLRWLGLYAGEPDCIARVVLGAAASGSLDAQARLGQLLLDGHGIQRDPSLALRWFGIAAAGGHVAARNMLGRCLHMGWGCAIDLAGAAQHYRLAAEQGDDWGCYNYANMLAKGWGVAVDCGAALAWYRRAADQGHAKAMNLVGRFYEEGWEVPQDLQRAFDWYQRSALAGDFRGQCSYASLLVAQGRMTEALEWLQRSMATATVPFLRTMAEALCGAAHASLRDMGERMQACVDARLSPPADAYAGSARVAHYSPTA